MLYMVEVKYAEDQRDAARKYFQEHGVTHYTGSLVVKGLWVATAQRIAYAVVDAAGDEEIGQACEPLKQFGDVQYRSVIEADQL